MGNGTTHRNEEGRWKFLPVLDAKKRKIKGLSQRNGRIYGTIWVSQEDARSRCRRFPLLDENGRPVVTIREAKTAYERLRGKARDEKLPLAGPKPLLADFAADYLASGTTQSKRPRTVKKESQSLGLWIAVFGATKIDKINTPVIRTFIEKRLKGSLTKDRRMYPSVSPRTVAVDIIALRNLLKAAVDAGYIREIPRFPKLKVSLPPRRSLVSENDFQRLIQACSSNSEEGVPLKNGNQLADLLLLLDTCGARETEAYAIAWKHVDFEGKRIWIGADPDFDATASHGSTGIGGISKNGRSRAVEMNPHLERHLLEMKGRRNSESIWLFPSPKSRKTDRPVITLRESLNLVRAAVGLNDFGFHDCRHRFASRCVMAGIDYMTTAKWLGHQDGGILVGKVYGHLSDDHRKRMAMRLEGWLACKGDP